MSSTWNTNNTTFPFGTNENAFANRNYSLFRLKYTEGRFNDCISFNRTFIRYTFISSLWWIRIARDKCGSGYCCDPWMWMQKTNREEIWSWSNMKQSNRLNCIRLNCRRVQFWTLMSACIMYVASTSSLQPSQTMMSHVNFYENNIFTSLFHHHCIVIECFIFRKKERERLRSGGMANVYTVYKVDVWQTKRKRLD